MPRISLSSAYKCLAVEEDGAAVEAHSASVVLARTPCCELLLESLRPSSSSGPQGCRLEPPPMREPLQSFAAPHAFPPALTSCLAAHPPLPRTDPLSSHVQPTLAGCASTGPRNGRSLRAAALSTNLRGHSAPWPSFKSCWQQPARRLPPGQIGRDVVPHSRLLFAFSGGGGRSLIFQRLASPRI